MEKAFVVIEKTAVVVANNVTVMEKLMVMEKTLVTTKKGVVSMKNLMEMEKTFLTMEKAVVAMETTAMELMRKNVELVMTIV